MVSADSSRSASLVWVVRGLCGLLGLAGLAGPGPLRVGASVDAVRGRRGCCLAHRDRIGGGLLPLLATTRTPPTV